MAQYDLFNEVAEIGREFLALSKSKQALQNYNWALGSLCDLIKHTHSIVIEKLEDIEAAQTTGEAKHAAQQLEDEPLTRSFRANGLCDIFQGFGVALRRVVEPSTQPSGSGGSAPLPIVEERKDSWLRFCHALEDKEREVASLYARELQDICNLSANASSPADLAQLKAKAQAARSLLTTQMAAFDALATQFRQLL